MRHRREKAYIILIRLLVKTDIQVPSGEGSEEEKHNKGEAQVKTGAEVGKMQPQAKGCRQPPELEEARKGFSTRASGGSGELPAP